MCIGVVGQASGGGGGRGSSGNVSTHKYSFVMRQLFKEMNSAMSQIVSKQKKSKGLMGTHGTSALVQKVQHILKADRNNESINTDTIGMFRNIFSQVASGVDRLYLQRKMDDFKKMEKKTKMSMRQQSERKKLMTAGTALKIPVKKIGSGGPEETKPGGPVVPLKGVDVPRSNKSSIKPILQRLKKLDVQRKHNNIYYQSEGSGSGSNSSLLWDDTEQGSGDELSGESDTEEESGSGGTRVVEDGKQGGGQVVQGEEYGQVVQHVARARDRMMS